MSHADPPDVLALLRTRIVAIMGVSPDDVAPDTRFDEDLHADSLDLVEVIEGVERDLREEGIDASLPDEDLHALSTVGDAAERIAAAARPGGL